MAKGPISSMADAGGEAREFTAQNTERAMQATNYGLDWMRQLTGHGLDQGKVIFDSLINSAHASAETIDRQAAELRERSLALVSRSVANGFDFAHRILRARDGHEVIQLQSEFLSRQAHALAEQAKELGQVMAQGAEEVGRQTLDQAQSAADQVRRKA
jgi:hypothetical protein